MIVLSCTTTTPRIHDEEKGYYADGEDAYDMRKYLAAASKKKGADVAEKKGGDVGQVTDFVTRLSLNAAGNANGAAAAGAEAGAEAEAGEGGEEAGGK